MMCCVMKGIIGGFVIIVLLASGCCMIALEFVVKNTLGVYFNLGWIGPLLLCAGIASIAASLFATLGLCNCCKCCCIKIFLFATMVCLCFVVMAEVGYMVKVHKSKEDMKDYLVKNVTSLFMGNMSEVYTKSTSFVKWTVLQAKFDCCGNHKPSDWTDNGVAIPQSCCKEFNFESIPEHFESMKNKDPKKLLELVSKNTCDVSEEENLKEEGCLEKLDTLFEKGFRILKWGVLGLLLFQIVAGAFFTYLFIKEVAESNSDDKSF